MNRDLIRASVKNNASSNVETPTPDRSTAVTVYNINLSVAVVYRRGQTGQLVRE